MSKLAVWHESATTDLLSSIPGLFIFFNVRLYQAFFRIGFFRVTWAWDFFHTYYRNETKLPCYEPSILVKSPAILRIFAKSVSWIFKSLLNFPFLVASCSRFPMIMLLWAVCDCYKHITYCNIRTTYCPMMTFSRFFSSKSLFRIQKVMNHIDLFLQNMPLFLVFRDIMEVCISVMHLLESGRTISRFFVYHIFCTSGVVQSL